MDEANDALRVNVVAGSGSGYAGQADESAFTEGTTVFAVMGGVLNDTIVSDPTEDQAAAARITAKRGLHTNLRNVGGTEVGVLAAPLRVDPTGTTAQPVTDNAGSLTVDAPIGTPVNVQVGDGTRTATVRDTGASDSLNVAIVDAGGNQITSFGGGTEYTEDAIPPANPVGATLNLRRRDALVAETDADGDWVTPNSTNKGELYVKHVDAIPVSQNGTWNINNVSGTVSLPTGASTLGEQQTQTTSLQLIDDVVHANDAALGKVAALGAQFDDTTPGTTTENNIRALRMSTRRELYVQVRDAAGNERGLNVDASGNIAVTDAGGSLTVDGTVATSSVVPGTGATNLGKAEDDPHVNGDVGVMALGVRKDTGATIAATDGDYSPLQVDASGNLRVNVAAGGAGDGAILDGVTPSIKATVFDFTNSNPLAVRLTDTAGDYVGAGAGTQYTEDVAAATDPIGTQVIARRRDTPASETTTDGDSTAVNCTSKGELYTKHLDTIGVTQSGTWNINNVSGTVSLPTGASTLGEQQTQTTSLQKIDNLAHSGSDVALVEHVPISGQFDDAAPTAVTENNVAPVRITSLRALHVQAQANGGVDIGDVTVNNAAGGSAVNIQDGGNSITVDGTVTANAGTGNFNVVGTKSDDTGAPGATNLGTLPAVANASVPSHTEGNQVSLSVDLSGRQRSDVSTWIGSTAPSIGSKTSANSIPVVVASDQGAIATTPAGNVAHDAVDSGNPVKTGAKAISHGSNPTAVAAADRTDLYANRHGVPFSIGGHPNTITTEFHFTTAQTDQALVTVGAGSIIVVTKCSATLSNATTVTVGVRVGLAAATLPAASSAGVTGMVLTHPGLAAGSGIVEGNGSGIIGRGADGEDLRLTSDVPTSGSLRVLVTYYTIES
jgi:hypothetical protein